MGLDEEAEKRMAEIREKYKDNPDIAFLFLELDNRGIALYDADRVARAIDNAVKAGRLGSRSEIADARNDYGNPFDYKFTPKRLARQTQ